MKGKVLQKKLEIKKETIARLEKEELKPVCGGATITCLYPLTHCLCVE